MNPIHPARCEWCGGIVSASRVKGDTSKPLNEDSYSASALFWHSECALAEQERYVSRRFHRTAEELRAEEERQALP